MVWCRWVGRRPRYRESEKPCKWSCGHFPYRPLQYEVVNNTRPSSYPLLICYNFTPALGEEARGRGCTPCSVEKINKGFELVETRL